MKDIVGSKGDTYVAQYLGKIVAKAQNLLPDSASITLNGVTLTENDLTALGNAKTSLEADRACEPHREVWRSEHRQLR